MGPSIWNTYLSYLYQGGVGYSLSRSLLVSVWNQFNKIRLYSNFLPLIHCAMNRTYTLSSPIHVHTYISRYMYMNNNPVFPSASVCSLTRGLAFVCVSAWIRVNCFRMFCICYYSESGLSKDASAWCRRFTFVVVNVLLSVSCATL